MKHIILLDMDGVLITARGYRAAIHATMQTLAAEMGQPHLPPPTEAEMLAFEAQSIIFEWDSLALMVAALLEQVPDHHADTVPDTLRAILAAGVTLLRPDYAALARECPPPTAEMPSAATLALGTRFPDTPLYRELLRETHTITPYLSRLFQHYVLGAAQFQATYDQAPLLPTESLLAAHDIPALTSAWRDKLLTTPAYHPCIYTARPSLPPSFDPDRAGYPPEAEIGQRLVGLEAAPLVAYGVMRWLAARAGLPLESFVKPAPMQARVAIFSALADTPQQAYDLALGHAAVPAAWLDAPWRVIVCEDSPASIQGVRVAVTTLAAELGHDITCLGVGIAQHDENIARLKRVADQVAPDVNAGLAWALG